MKRVCSIRTKLIAVFVIAFVLVFAVNMYQNDNQNKTIYQIDSVYNSSIRLNELSVTLDHMQEALYQYLNTKSSDQLQTYYACEQDYQEMLRELNTLTVDEPDLLMEKNIYHISETYLEETRQAVEAKRGRNVSGYNESYGNAKRVYGYLQSFLKSTNTTVFLQNSYNYSLLRSSLNEMTSFGRILQLAVILVAVA